MATKVGLSSATGTGTKTLLTGLSGAPSWCRLTIVNDLNSSIGASDGTRQDVVWTAPTSGSSNTKITHLEDSSGNVVFEAAWSSFGTSGANGTVSLNVTTNTAGVTVFLLEVGN